MEEQGNSGDGTADICSIILQADADDPMLFDLSGPSFSESTLATSPTIAGIDRNRSTGLAKPQEFLRDATWRSLAEAHEDHQQLRSTLQRAGQLCNSAAVSGYRADTITSPSRHRAVTSLLEAVNEMPEWGAGSLPDVVDEMPDRIRKELRSVVSDAVNTIGGQVASIRFAMQDHLLEHASAHCNAVHGVRSDYADVSTDVKEMRSVMSGMRTVMLEAFTDMVAEIRQAVPSTVADLKEEISSMRDLMHKSFEEQRDIIANLHGHHTEGAADCGESKSFDAVPNVSEEDAVQESPLLDIGDAAKAIAKQDLADLRASLLEVSAQQKVQHIEILGDIKEGSELSQALRNDLRASQVALETLSQHAVEQHIVLHKIEQELAQHRTVQENPTLEARREADSPPEAVEELECPEATPFQEQGGSLQSEQVPREQAEAASLTAVEMSNLCSAVVEALTQQKLALDDLRRSLLSEETSEMSTMERLNTTQSAVLDAFAQQHVMLQDVHEKLSLDVPGGLSSIREMIDRHSMVHESVMQQNAALEGLQAELPKGMSMIADAQSQLFQAVSKLSRYQDELIQDVQHERPEVLATVKTEVNRVLFDQLRSVRTDISRDVRSDIGEGIARINSVVLEAISHLTNLQEEIMRAVQPERPEAVPSIKDALVDFRSMLHDRLSQHKQEQHDFHNFLRQTEPQKDVASAVMGELAGLPSMFSNVLANHQSLQESVQRDIRSEIQEVSVRLRSTFLEESLKHRAQLDQINSELRQEHHAAIGIIRKEIADLQSGLLVEFFKHHSMQDEFIRSVRQEREAAAITKEEEHDARIHNKQEELQEVQKDTSSALMAELAGLHLKFSTMLANYQSCQEKAQCDTRLEFQEALVRLRSGLFEEIAKQHAQLDKASGELRQEHHTTLGIMRKEMGDLQSGLLQELFKHHGLQDDFLRNVRKEREAAAASTKEEVEGMRSSIVHESISHHRIVQDDVGRELMRIRSILEDLMRHRAELQGSTQMLPRAEGSAERVATLALTEEVASLRGAVFEAVQHVSPEQAHFNDALESIRAELNNVQSSMLEPLSELKLTLDSLTNTSLQQEREAAASTLDGSARRVLEECLQDKQLGQEERSLERSAEVMGNETTPEAMETALQQHATLDKVFQMLLMEQTAVKRITDEMADIRSTVMEAIGTTASMFQEELHGICRLVQDMRQHEQSLHSEQAAQAQATELMKNEVRDKYDALQKDITQTSEKAVHMNAMTFEEVKSLTSMLLDALSQQRRMLDSMSSGTSSDLSSFQAALFDKLKRQEELLYRSFNVPGGLEHGEQSNERKDAEPRHALQEELFHQRRLLETVGSAMQKDLSNLRSEVLGKVEDIPDSLRKEWRECTDAFATLKGEIQSIRASVLGALPPQQNPQTTPLGPHESDLAFEEIKRMCSAVLETHAQHKFLLEDVPSSVKSGTSEIKGEVQTHGLVLERIQKTNEEVKSMHSGILEAITKIGECPETLLRLEHEVSSIRYAMLEAKSHQNALLQAVPSTLNRECGEMCSAIKQEVASIRAMMQSTEAATPADLKAVQSGLLEVLNDQKVSLDASLQQVREPPETFKRLEHDIETILSTMPKAISQFSSLIETEMTAIRSMLDWASREPPSLDREMKAELKEMRSAMLEAMSTHKEAIVESLQQELPSIKGASQAVVKALPSGLLEAIVDLHNALLGNDFHQMGEIPETISKLQSAFENRQSAILEAIIQQNTVLQAVPASFNKEYTDVPSAVEGELEGVADITLGREEAIHAGLKAVQSGLLQVLADQTALLDAGFQKMEELPETLKRLEHRLETLQANMPKVRSQEQEFIEDGIVSAHAIVKSIPERVPSTEIATTLDTKSISTAILRQIYQKLSLHGVLEDAPVALTRVTKAEVDHIKAIVESFQHEVPCIERASKDIAKAMSSGLPESIVDLRNALLDAGLQKMGESPASLAKLQHDVADSHASIMGAISQQNTMLQVVMSNTDAMMKSTPEEVPGTDVAKTSDVKSMSSAILRQVYHKVSLKDRVERVEECRGSHVRIEQEAASLRLAVLNAFRQQSAVLLQAIMPKAISQQSASLIEDTVASIRSMIEGTSGEAPSPDVATQLDLNNTHFKVLEAMSDHKAVLDASVEKMTGCPAALARIEHEVSSIRSAFLDALSQQGAVLEDRMSSMCAMVESKPTEAPSTEVAIQSDLKSLHSKMVEAISDHKVLLDASVEKMTDCPASLTRIELQVASVRSALLDALSQQNDLLEALPNIMAETIKEAMSNHKAALDASVKKIAEGPASLAEGEQADVSTSSTLLASLSQHRQILEDVPSALTSVMRGEVDRIKVIVESFQHEVPRIERATQKITKAMSSGFLESIIDLHNALLDDSLQKIGELPASLAKLHHDVADRHSDIMEAISQQNTMLQTLPIESFNKECSQLRLAMSAEMASIRDMVPSSQAATQADLKTVKLVLQEVLADHTALLDSGFQKMRYLPETLKRLEDEMETLQANMPIDISQERSFIEAGIASTHAMVKSTPARVPSTEVATTLDTKSMSSAVLRQVYHNVTLNAGLEGAPVILTSMTKGEVDHTKAKPESFQHEVSSMDIARKEIAKVTPSGLMESIIDLHNALLDAGLQKMGEFPASFGKLQHDVADSHSTILEAISQQSAMLQVVMSNTDSMAKSAPEEVPGARANAMVEAAWDAKSMSSAILRQVYHKVSLEKVDECTDSSARVEQEAVSNILSEQNAVSEAVPARMSKEMKEEVERIRATVEGIQQDLPDIKEASQAIVKVLPSGLLEAIVNLQKSLSADGLQNMRELPQTFARLEHDVANIQTTTLEAIAQQTAMLQAVPASLTEECSNVSSLLKNEVASIVATVESTLRNAQSTEEATQSELKATHSRMLEAMSDHKLLLDTGIEKMTECPASLARMENAIASIRTVLLDALSQQSTGLEDKITSINTMVESTLRESQSTGEATQSELNSTHSKMLDTISHHKALLDAGVEKMTECPALLAKIEQEVASIRSVVLDGFSQQSIVLEDRLTSIRAMVESTLTEASLTRVEHEVTSIRHAVLDSLSQQTTVLEDMMTAISAMVEKTMREGPSTEEATQSDSEVMHSKMFEDHKALLERVEQEVASIRSTFLDALSQQSMAIEAVPNSLIKAFRGEMESIQATVETLQGDLPNIKEASQAVVKAMPSGLLESVNDLHNALLDDSVQKMGECPSTLVKLEHEVADIRSTILQARSQQKEEVEALHKSLIKESEDGAREIEVLRMMNEDFVSMHCAVWKKLEQQMCLLDSFCNHTREDTSETVKTLSVELMEVHSGILQAMTDQTNSLDAGIQKLERTTSQCPDALSRIQAGIESKMEGMQSTMSEAFVQQSSASHQSVSTEADIKAVCDSLQGAVSECKQLLKDVAADVRQEQIAEILTSLTEELTDMRSMFMGSLSKHQSTLNDVSGHVRRASEAVVAPSESTFAEASSMLKEQQVLLDGFNSTLQQTPSQAAAAVKAEFLEMRSMLIDAVIQKLQADASRPNLDQDRQILTQIEGELTQLQSACLEALGEQKMKLEEICGNISGAPAASRQTDLGEDKHDEAHVLLGDESHAHAQFAEVLKAEVADIRSMLTDVIAQDDGSGREMRTKIHDGLTNMFSMVLEALTQLTLLQDEVMRGLRPEHPRKAVITSNGEFIDVRAVVEEVLDQYSILKEEHTAENQIVQAELKQMTSQMTEALDRQKFAIDNIRMQAAQESPEALKSVQTELIDIRTVFSELAHHTPDREELQEQAVAAVKDELINVRSMILEALAQLHGEHDELGRQLRSIMEEGLVNLRSTVTEGASRRPSLMEELSERTPPGAADLTGDSEEAGTSSFTNIFF